MDKAKIIVKHYIEMRKILVVLLKYMLFWLGYFWLSKAVFLLYNFNLTSEVKPVEIFKIFFIGSRLDLSMTSYLLVLPGIVFSLSVAVAPRILNVVLYYYTLIILLSVSVLNVLDLGLYPHWGTRIGISAFDYLGDPKGMAANVTWVDSIKALFVFALFFVSFVFIYRYQILAEFKQVKIQKWYFGPVLLFLTACLIIPIRGGFSVSPINQSTVSFSSKLYVNHAASNFLWNFFDTVDRRKKTVNPCQYFTDNEAFRIFGEVENNRVFLNSVLITQAENPHVVVIVLESFSNKVISAMGGDYGVCPNLDTLCSESIVFTDFYASGNRSDRGMSALLASYPSLLRTSIIRFPDKSEKLTMISDYFNRKNYETSFYYGGDINFYNMRSMILQGDYNRIIEQYDFPREIQKISKWGVPDGYLFDRVFDEFQQIRKPSFTVVYTISSHPPYDVPVKLLEGETDELKYLNSVAYTDSCLGEFIRKFKKTEMWKNSLVIITADHGALFPGPTDITDPETYKIPLIWTGGLVAKHQKFDVVGGQADLAATLVTQLGWKPDQVTFGHDLFSKPEYAFYMTDNGWGYVTPGREHYYDNSANNFKTFYAETAANTDLEFAKAYLQVLHEDFLKK